MGAGNGIEFIASDTPFSRDSWVLKSEFFVFDRPATRNDFLEGDPEPLRE